MKIMQVNQFFITINNILNVDSDNSSIFSCSSSPAFSVSVTVVLRSCKHRGAPISKQCLLKEHYCTIVSTRGEALVHIEGPWLELACTNPNIEPVTDVTVTTPKKSHQQI